MIVFKNDEIPFIEIDDSDNKPIFTNKVFELECKADEKIVSKVFKPSLKTRIVIKVIDLLFKLIKDNYKVCFTAENGKNIGGEIICYNQKICVL